MYIQIHAPITNNAVTIIPNVVIVFIKRSVKPTDADRVHYFFKVNTIFSHNSINSFSVKALLNQLACLDTH